VGSRVANQAKLTENAVPSLTAQQIEQLLKLLPSTTSNGSSIGNPSEDTDEELDYSFAGIAICFHAEQECIDWVIDTGATDHMTSE